MAGINILIQIFTSFMSCLIIKSFLDALFIRRTIKNKTIFLWIFYFLLSLYCENNNNITLPKLFLSAAGVLVICLIAYDGKLHKKIAMVFLYHFIWIAIEMLLGYTIMSIGTNRNKKRKCNIRKTNFLISGANICKRNCHVK